MERFRLRPLLLLLAVALSALAVGWYFADGDETVEMVETDTVPAVALGEEEASRGPQMSTNAVTTTSGLQGTVPDTVGQNEATATSTLDGAGYRVRLMTRTVSTRREAGVVVQQLPTGGTRRIGSTVTIVVGRLP